MWDYIKNRIVRRLRSNTYRKAVLTLIAAASATIFPEFKAFIAENIVAILIVTGGVDAGLREVTKKPLSER